jgi:hypothetical protein
VRARRVICRCPRGGYEQRDGAHRQSK